MILAGQKINAVGAALRGGPQKNTCHSEPRSGEESREQNAMRNHTGSFTSFRMTAYFRCSSRAATQGRPHGCAL